MSTKVLHWLPRVICILAILFISLFALDSFEPELTIWQQISAFLMHLIPSIVLTVMLIIAWKRELLGGIIFLLIGLGMTPLVYIENYDKNQSIGMSLGIIMSITFPFIVVGILFIFNHYRKKKLKLN